MKFNEDVNISVPYCLHPVRITKGNQTILVPCRKCSACRNLKGFTNKQLIQLEDIDHKKCFFVTLTYNEDFVPRAIVNINRSSSEVSIDINMYRNKYVTTDVADCISRLESNGRECIDTVYYDSSDRFDEILSDSERNLNTNILSSDYNILYKPDLQRFIDALRKDLLRKGYGKLRYFACGEYGPKRLRPHYHLLLWFENDFPQNFEFERTSHGKTKKYYTNEYVDKTISTIWKYGLTTTEISKGQCASYVSGYVNSYCNIPTFLSCDGIKPFCTHSKGLGLSFYLRKRDKIYSFKRYEEIKDFAAEFLGVDKRVSPTLPIENFFFPKCYGYGLQDSRINFAIYTMYATAVKYFRCRKSPQIAREIIEDIQNYQFKQEKEIQEKINIYRNITEIVHFVGLDGRSYHVKTTPLLQRLIPDSSCLNSNYIASPSTIEGLYFFVIQYIYINNLDLSIYDDCVRVFNWLCCCLNTSKHFLKFVSKDIPPKVAFERIERYYKTKDYYNLCNQLKAFDAISKSDISDSDRQIIQDSLYTEFYDEYEFAQSRLYRNFAALSKKIERDSTKTKKINDSCGILKY